MNSQDFLSICYTLSMGILVLAFFTNGWCVLRPLLKHLRVPNGLGKLRVMMFSRVGIGELIIAIVLFLLSLRFFTTDPHLIRYVVGTLVVTFSIGMLAKIIIDAIITSQQFTAEHIEKAMRIQMEMNREKVMNKNV